MTYKLIITERADELIDACIGYILFTLKNPGAALHLLDGIEALYSRLEENPFQFPECKDAFLSQRGYHEALVSDMHYKLVFRIDTNTVFVVGLFHDLEDYEAKVNG